LLLSKKLFTAFNRKRPKGRDFYDILFLLGKTKPNYQFLSQKIQIDNAGDLVEYLNINCAQIDFKELLRDLRPFVFMPKDAERILYFVAYINSKKELF
jgi:hypothetical protein